MSIADRLGHQLLDVRCRSTDSLVFKLQHQLLRPSELGHDSSLFSSLIAHIRSLLPPSSAGAHLAPALRALVLLTDNQPLGCMRVVQSAVLADLQQTLSAMRPDAAPLAAHLLAHVTATAARSTVPHPAAPCAETTANANALGLGQVEGVAPDAAALLERERRGASDAVLARIFKYNDPSRAWQQERLAEDIPVDEGGWALRRIPLGAADEDLLVDLTLKLQYSGDVQGAQEALALVLERALLPSLPAEALLQHPSLLRCTLRLLDAADRSAPLTTLVLQCSERVVEAIARALQHPDDQRPGRFPSAANEALAGPSAGPPAALFYPPPAISSSPADCGDPSAVLCATSALHVIVKALLPLVACPDRAPHVLALVARARPFLAGPRGAPTKHQAERATQLLAGLAAAWAAVRALGSRPACGAREPGAPWSRHTLALAQLALAFLELLPGDAAAPSSAALPPSLLNELGDLLQQDVVLRCTDPALQLAARLERLAPRFFPSAGQRAGEVAVLEGQVAALMASVDRLGEALSLGAPIAPRLAPALDALSALTVVPSNDAVRTLAEAALQSLPESEDGRETGARVLCALASHPQAWVRGAAARQVAGVVGAECRAAMGEGSRPLGPGAVLALCDPPGVLEALALLALLPEAPPATCPALVAQMLLDLTTAAAAGALEAVLDVPALFARLRRLLPLLQGAAHMHGSTTLGAVVELVRAHTARDDPLAALRDDLLALFSLSALDRRAAVDRLAARLPCQALAPVASDPFENALDQGATLERLAPAALGPGIETFTAQDARALLKIVRAPDLPASVRKPAADQLGVLVATPRLAASVLADSPDFVEVATAEALAQCALDLTLAAALLEAPLVLILTHPGLGLAATEALLVTLGCLALCQSSAVRVRAGAILFRVLADALLEPLPAPVKELLTAPPSRARPLPVTVPPYLIALYGAPLPVHVCALPQGAPTSGGVAPPAALRSESEKLQRLLVRQVLRSPEVQGDVARLAAALEEDASLGGRLPPATATELRATLLHCRFESNLAGALAALGKASDHAAYRAGLLRLTAMARATTPAELMALLAAPWPAALDRLIFTCPANRDDLFLWAAALEFLTEMIARAAHAEGADGPLLSKALRLLTLAYQRSVVAFFARHATGGAGPPSGPGQIAAGAAAPPVRTGPPSAYLILAGAAPTAAGWGPLEPERNAALSTAVTLQLLQLLATHCTALVKLQDRSAAQDLLSTLGGSLLPYLTRVIEGPPGCPELLPALTLASLIAQAGSLAFPDQSFPSAIEDGFAALAKAIVRQVLVRDASAKGPAGDAAPSTDRFPGFAAKGAMRAALAAAHDLFAALPPPALSRTFIDLAATAWIARAVRDRESGCARHALAILTRVLGAGDAEARAFLQRAWPDLQTLLCRLVTREVADRATIAAALQALTVTAAQFEDAATTPDSGFGLTALGLRADVLQHVATAVLPRALVHRDAALASAALGLLALVASADVALVAAPLAAFVAAPHRPWDAGTAAAAWAARVLQRGGESDGVMAQLGVLTYWANLASLLATSALPPALSLLQDPFLLPALYAAAATAADLYLNPQGLHPEATTGRRIHAAAAAALLASLSALSQIHSSDPAQDLAHHGRVHEYAADVAADIRAELRIPPEDAPSALADRPHPHAPHAAAFVPALRKLIGNAAASLEVQAAALSVLSALSANPEGFAVFAAADPSLPSAVAPLTTQYLRAVSGTGASTSAAPEDVRYGSVICLRNMLQSSAAAREAFVQEGLSDVLAEGLDAFALHIVALSGTAPRLPSPKQAQTAAARREKLAHIARRLKQSKAAPAACADDDKENAVAKDGGRAPALARATPPSVETPTAPHVERACTALSVLLACAANASDALRQAVASAGAVRLAELLFTWALECEPLLHWLLALCRALLPRNPAAIAAATAPAHLTIRGRPLETRGRLLELIARLGAATALPPSLRAAAHEVLTLAASSLPGAQAILRLPFAQDLPNCLRPAGLRRDGVRAPWAADLLLALAAHPEVAPHLLRGPFAGLLDLLVDGIDGSEACTGEPTCPAELHATLFSTLCLLGAAPENKAHFASHGRALGAVASRASVDAPEKQAVLATACLAQLLQGSGGERVKALLKKVAASDFSAARLRELRQRWSSKEFLYGPGASEGSASVPVVSHVLACLEEGTD